MGSEENEDNSENSLVVNSISDALPLSEIDQKIIDVAITSTAYAAITMNKELVIWGDYSKIYSEIGDNASDKSKKKIKKTKPKKNDNPKDEDENKEPTKTYVVVKPHNESIDKNESETEAEEIITIQYKNITSCSNSFIVLDEHGNVYAFGQNDFGVLGLSKETKERMQPQKIVFDTESEIRIVSLSSYENGCLALDNNQNVWFWGKLFNDGDAKINTSSDQEDKDNDDAPIEEAGIYLPIKICIESTPTQTQKAILTRVGGFLLS